MDKKSQTLILEPSLVVDRTETLLPRKVKDRTDMLPWPIAFPVADSELPMRAKARRESADAHEV